MKTTLKSPKETLYSWRFEDDTQYMISILPEIYNESIGCLEIEALEYLCESEDEFNFFLNKYQNYEIIPFSEEILYSRYALLHDAIVNFQNNGIILIIKGKNIIMKDLINKFALISVEVEKFQDNVRIIGFNVRKDYEIDELKYYLLYTRRDCYDLLDTGITLSQKCNFIRNKLRRRYHLFLLHLSKYLKILDIKPILLHIISLTVNILKIEVSLKDLFKLGLFPFSIIPEFNYFIPDEITETKLIFAEMLSTNFEDIINKRYEENLLYVNLICNGTIFMHNWNESIRLYELITDETININPFPGCLIDYFSNFYTISSFRSEEQWIYLEKLVCTILYKEINPAINYLRNTKLDINENVIDDEITPPIELYRRVYNLDNNVNYVDVMQDAFSTNAIWINRTKYSFKFNIINI